MERDARPGSPAPTAAAGRRAPAMTTSLTDRLWPSVAAKRAAADEIVRSPGTPSRTAGTPSAGPGAGRSRHPGISVTFRSVVREAAVRGHRRDFHDEELMTWPRRH